MALPTKVKTWSIDPCNRETCATLLEAMGDCNLGIKNAIKLMSGVTVKGSCNGTTGAMDGTDRWTVTGDVQTRNNGAAGAQSWIVLDLANMGGAELLLTYNSASTAAFSYYLSPGGLYTVAGTATHKPTATDELAILSAAAIMTTSATADRLWSTWVASDGSALYWAIAEAGEWTSAVGVQIVTSRCAVGVTFSPSVAAFSVGVSGTGGLLSSWGTARPVARLNPGTGAVNISGFFGAEGYKTGIAATLQANVCELQGGGHNIYPVSLWSETATARGAVANWIDLWCGNTSANDGDTYPNDATRLFIQVTDFILPWDGTAVVMT